MNRNALLMAILLTGLLSGCAANQQIAFLSSGVTSNQGISAKNLRSSANLGLQSAIGSGADIVIVSALLLNSSDYQTTVAKYDHLEVWMPLSEAKDKHQAKLKMSAILENAIHKTLAVGYKSRIDEYENEAVLGAVNRTRFIRIDGPDCENWSCAAYTTIPSETASQWQGNMIKYAYQAVIAGKQCPCYVYDGLQGGVRFVKILKEHDRQGLISGHWHQLESKPNHFGGEAFYSRLSANLPDWVYCYVAKQPVNTTMTVPALFNQGRRLY